MNMPAMFMLDHDLPLTKAILSTNQHQDDLAIYVYLFDWNPIQQSPQSSSKG
jgi:hypothetical protein